MKDTLRDPVFAKGVAAGALFMLVSLFAPWIGVLGFFIWLLYLVKGEEQ